MSPAPSPLEVTPVPCLSDNYAYLVICKATNASAIVDPSEAVPVVQAVTTANLRPQAIWNTHHHHDHTGGNEEVAKQFGIDVIAAHASDRGRVAGQTRFLEAGERFQLGQLDVEILHIPGHTLGAIAYVVRSAAGDVALFTGDTMFLGGCGRLFEGTPADMHGSLQQLLATGDAARVFPGHEYTAGNLRFAASIEPRNDAVRQAQQEVEALRAAHKPTVGTTIARERATNPFVRTDSPEIRASVGIAPSADAATALGAIRKAKDAFK